MESFFGPLSDRTLRVLLDYPLTNEAQSPYAIRKAFSKPPPSTLFELVMDLIMSAGHVIRIHQAEIWVPELTKGVEYLAKRFELNASDLSRYNLGAFVERVVAIYASEEPNYTGRNHYANLATILGFSDESDASDDSSGSDDSDEEHKKDERLTKDLRAAGDFYLFMIQAFCLLPVLKKEPKLDLLPLPTFYDLAGPEAASEVVHALTKGLLNRKCQRADFMAAKHEVKDDIGSLLFKVHQLAYDGGDGVTFDLSSTVSNPLWSFVIAALRHMAQHFGLEYDQLQKYDVDAYFDQLWELYCDYKN